MCDASETILIALGANQSFGEFSPRDVLVNALNLVESYHVDVVKASAWFETPAFPAGSGPAFVNAAAQLSTDLSPEGLLDVLHATERSLGRRRDQRWGARSCDLDLLAWGDRVIPDTGSVRNWMALDLADQMDTTPDRLVLPHPRLHERAFVLVPLAEIAPNWCHPILGKTCTELLDSLDPEDCKTIKKLF